MGTVKLEKQEVLNRLADLGVEMLTENYINTNTIYTFRCSNHNCNNTYDSKLKYVLNSGRTVCKECIKLNIYDNRKIEMNNEEINSLLVQKGVRIKDIGIFNIHSIEKFICKCGNTFERKIEDVLYKGLHKCELCKSKRTTNEEFLEKVKSITGDEYIFLENFKTQKTSIKVKHSKCGHEYRVAPYNFLTQGHRCPKCGKQLLKTFDLVKEECLELYPDKEYEIVKMIKEWKRGRLNIKHNKCNHIFEMNYAPFIQNNGKCPQCFGYKGEVRILKYLKENNINYNPQHTFEDLKIERKLKFDFAIFDKNDNLKCLIEFQGRQHYEVVRFNGIDLNRASLAYEKVIRNDKIKEAYCKENNIPLHIIPYKEENKIEEILENIILKI